MNTGLKITFAAALAAIFVAGCTTTETRLAGAGAGAAAGAVMAGPIGAAVGGVAGAVAGPSVARKSPKKKRRSY